MSDKLVVNESDLRPEDDTPEAQVDGVALKETALGIYLVPKTQEHVLVEVKFDPETGLTKLGKELYRTLYRSECQERFKIEAVNKGIVS